MLTTATAVDPCPAGQYSTDGSACAAVTAGTTVAGCRSYSALAGTLANCVVAVDGYSLVGGVITLCSQDQFSSGGAACAAITSGVTGVTNCKVYSTAAATKCVIPKPGFFLNAAGTTATACISGCDECTDATLAGCTKAAVGKYLKNPGASQTIEPCGDNCNTCTAPVAPATTPACTATKAGYKLVSGAPVACGAGEGSPDNNTAATCTACTATQVVVKGSCVARCDAATLGADYLTYGNKCCFATATNSALVGVGVATCATPVPTAVGEYNAATCSAGFFLNNGACEKVCSATTADAAAYGTNGGMKCCSKDKDNNLKGKGVNTCPPADPA